MSQMPTKCASVDEYISSFPDKTRTLLTHLRAIINKAVPEAEEVISYQMPAFKQNGPLVYFAGYEKHIGFYPAGSGIKAFQKEISAYKHSKGAIQFPLDKPLPVRLITRIVKYKLQENLTKVKSKKSLKK